jgi:hypothetical protein
MTFNETGGGSSERNINFREPDDSKTNSKSEKINAYPFESETGLKYYKEIRIEDLPEDLQKQFSDWEKTIPADQSKFKQMKERMDATLDYAESKPLGFSGRGQDELKLLIAQVQRLYIEAEKRKRR